MLTINVEEKTLYDESTNTFIEVKKQTLQLEHSLISLSKWESKWCTPFLTKKEKTYEETIDYIKCMTLTQNVDPYVYYCLTAANIKEINDYISAPMTATTFYEGPGANKGKPEIVTAELIYYWMIALQIPVEFQKWHLNRLLTLIRVCNIKNTPPKKRNQREIASSYKALNEARKKQFNTKG